MTSQTVVYTVVGDTVRKFENSVRAVYRCVRWLTFTDFHRPLRTPDAPVYTTDRDCPLPSKCYTNFPCSSALVASFNRTLWHSIG